MRNFAKAGMGARRFSQSTLVYGAALCRHAGYPGPTAPANPAEALSAPVQTVFSSKIGFLDSDPRWAPAIRASSSSSRCRRAWPVAGDVRAQGCVAGLSQHRQWRKLAVSVRDSNLTGQPALYELPRKMGDFPAGTVMAAGIGASAPGSKTLRLDLSVSSDGGKSWKALSTISEGGIGRYDPVNRAALSIQNPVWEPYLYADARGELVAYISNEGHKGEGYSQLLEHKLSSDGGKSWGPAVYDVAIGDGLTRPGMAVVTQGAGGKFFMSYEVVDKPGVALEPRSNLVHFKTSNDGLNWGDVHDYGTFIQDRWRQYANGTPFIAWSPWGGANGTLMVTGRSILRYQIGRVGNGMMINRNNGEGLWTLIETPIVYNPELDGYSQTMIALGNGEEILQMVSVNNRIAYAKFRLPAVLPRYPFPFGGPSEFKPLQITSRVR